MHGTFISRFPPAPFPPTMTDPTADPPADAAAPDARAAVDALNERAWGLRVSDAQEGLRLAERARVAARAVGYARGEAYALRNSGGCRCVLLEHEAALADLDRAGRIFDELGHPPGKASTLYWCGNVYWRRAEYASAARAYQEALLLQRAAGDRDGEGDSLNALGTIYFDTGDVARALENYTASLAVKEETGAGFGISNCLNNLGNVHGHLGEYPKAIEYHTRALALKRELGDVRGQAVALVNLGASYEATTDFPRALECFAQALEIARSIGERWIEADALRQMADVHRKSHEPARALEFYRKAASVAVDSGLAHLEAEIRVGIGLASAALGWEGEAVAELQRALALAQRIEARRLVYEAHLALSETYEAARKARQALEHFRAYHRVEDEVFSTEAERRIQAVLVKAEIERSEREAELLRAKNEELSAANEEKARLLEVLRRQAEELDRLSREDALTGLFNRRHVDEALALEWERSARFGRDLAVAIADVDHFKAVNDRFSHAAGDEVLRRVARILREGTRAVDVAGRWGGEEFVLLLVETPPDRAAHLCDKLRGAVEAHDWSAIAPGLAVTVSLGVAGNAEAADPAALLAAADARLYQAKRAGRNRVVAE
jgi:diguanylate cyclase (GGDEF)-like protein